MIHDSLFYLVCGTGDVYSRACLFVFIGCARWEAPSRFSGTSLTSSRVSLSLQPIEHFYLRWVQFDFLIADSYLGTVVYLIQHGYRWQPAHGN